MKCLGDSLRTSGDRSKSSATKTARKPSRSRRTPAGWQFLAIKTRPNYTDTTSSPTSVANCNRHASYYQTSSPVYQRVMYYLFRKDLNTFYQANKQVINYELE
jgi:hypothetical protein